jgi:anthranilate/para-aminobenzoate synthase component I
MVGNSAAVEPVVREVTLPPSIDALARALRGAPGLAVLKSDLRGAVRTTDAMASFVACDPVETCEAWVPPEGSVARGWNGRHAGPRWIGLVPYEATRAIERAGWRRHRTDDRPRTPLAQPRWQRYDAVLRVDHATGRVVVEADGARAAEKLLARVAAGRSAVPRPVDARLVPDPRGDDLHADRIREALRHIAAGDIYQVNLARAIDVELRSGDPIDAFLALYRASPAPFGFFAELGDAAVCAASPELALEVRGDGMRSAPIKGTRPRGEDARGDAVLAAALDRDAKERAELTMAIDLHRNDLGRVAAIGSVRAVGEPRVLGGLTVWSRVAEVVARRAEGVTLETIARAVLPCGSVTGAPKVRAMEIIADLEPLRRGAYTGAFGYVSRENHLVLGVAIRTLEIFDRSWGRYGAGGGIVADSDPRREVEETHWKAAQLAALLGRAGGADGTANLSAAARFR